MWLFDCSPGPFAPCHDFRDPDPFYDSCKYDVCALGEEYLCDSLAEYAEACRQSGGQPGDWRAETPVCRKSCIPLRLRGMSYESSVQKKCLDDFVAVDAF